VRQARLPRWLKLAATRRAVGQASHARKVLIAGPIAVAASAVGWVLYQSGPLSTAIDFAAPFEVAVALTLIALCSAVLTGVYALRRRRHNQEDTAKPSADQSYHTAVEQLGHDQPAVRLAGLSAIAQLADDWPKRRQQCIDTLCEYLRTPAETPPSAGESAVRATFVQTISEHLRDQSSKSWIKQSFDFSGAAFEDADFADVTFSGRRTSFAKATFSGGRTSFARATFSGAVARFDQATFSGGVARFDGTTFSGRHTTFGGATFSGWHAIFDGATFSGKYTNFGGATFSGWYTNFDGATFSGTSTKFDGATFSSKQTGFDGTTFSAKLTGFDQAIFSGKHISFEGSIFSGGTTADEATVNSVFVGSTVLWGSLSRRPLPSPALGSS
jgi:uncharacterized protein YjbI with pentapeptide repeats